MPPHTPHPHPWHARPYLPSANHLLGRIDGLAAPRTALGAPNLLGKLGRVGVGGGPVAGGPAQGRACGEGMYRERHGVGGTGLEGTTRLHLAQPAPRPPLPGLQGHLPDGGHTEDQRVTSADRGPASGPQYSFLKTSDSPRRQLECRSH